MNRAAILLFFCALVCFVTSCGAARQGYEEAQLKANEASLTMTLSQMREVLKQYKLDQGNPPRKIDDLVKDGYISQIPEDPMSGKADWILIIENCPPRPSDCREGIVNIRSASRSKSTRGDHYSDW